MTSATTITTTTTNPPVLLTLPRLIIRPCLLTDAPFAAHHGNDPAVSQNMRDTFPNPYTFQDAEYFITNIASETTSAPLRPEGILLNYALCLPSASGGEYIGGIGLKPLNDVEARTIEVGYWIGREHWGKGYATEAVGAFSRWAFETFPDVLRLEARVHEGNGGSEAVLRKAGYQKEGVRRKAVWKHGRALDMVLHGMLREECPGLKG
ncbi:putative N-acetyltransferase p20 [Cytospora mali]|uniref:N-acetyltransferase p20 n=1 Tax=Cytospora mali TaxID=578113 RepID=A0A194VAP7_CYTMA|nr:putative N-acetyltransferase p20 [Valsa mali var. pyri (nom. inval.)]